MSETESPRSATTFTNAARDAKKAVKHSLQKNESELKLKRFLSSSLDDYAKRQKEILSRIERLESLIEKTTTMKRRRASLLLNSRPNYRSTHLRLYNFHHCDDNANELVLISPSPIPNTNLNTNTTNNLTNNTGGGNMAVPTQIPPVKSPSFAQTQQQKQWKKGTKWTFVLEGRLLVPDSSVTTQKMRKIEKNASISSTGLLKLPENNPSSTSFDTKKDTRTSNATHTDEIYKRNENNESSILFTHLFDKVTVSFQKIYEYPKTSSTNKKDSVPSIKIKKRRTSNSKAASLSKITLSPKNSNQTVRKVSNPTPQVLTWTRPNHPPIINSEGIIPSNDAHAFHAIYFDQDDEISSTNIDNEPDSVQREILPQSKIIVTASLYRHIPLNTNDIEIGNESQNRYKPSEQFIRLLVPHFIPKDPHLEALNSNQSKTDAVTKAPRKKAKITISMNSNKKKKQPKTSSVSHSSDSQSQNTSSFDSSTTNIDTDHSSFHIPQTISLSEAVTTIFLYIKEHHLQDRSDLSIINNDETLASLFGCRRMLFSKVQELLLEQKLLTLITCENMEPVTITYVMTKEGATPIPSWMTTTKNTNVSGQNTSSKMDKTLSSQDSIHESKISTKRKRGDASSTDETEPLPQRLPESLIFNINVSVPSNFHMKIRDLLQLVKRRELEYTTSRAKALKMLQTIIGSNYGSNSISAKKEGNFLKSKLQETIVSGSFPSSYQGGFMGQHHVPVLMTIAKAAPEGSEVEQSAYIDARVGLLCDRLNYHIHKANLYWEVANVCKRYRPDKSRMV